MFDIIDFSWSHFVPNHHGLTPSAEDLTILVCRLFSSAPKESHTSFVFTPKSAPLA
jgi:hypothetical protein